MIASVAVELTTSDSEPPSFFTVSLTFFARNALSLTVPLSVNPFLTM